tara:strand:- start:36 stop:623 length:588 start_codon:yes stop_codon:yes gene_type:complete
MSKFLKNIIIFINFYLFFVTVPIIAHQPVLDAEGMNTKKMPFIIEQPEISKAIFSELKGDAHYYKIESDSSFKFYAGITVPKINDCPLLNRFSFEVLDEKFNIIERKDGENFKWWAWYEKHGENWYWIGPEIGENFKSNRIYKSGTYYIRVYNKSKSGKYVLAVGDIESFPFTVILRMIFTMPKINSYYWDNVNC